MHPPSRLSAPLALLAFAFSLGLPATLSASTLQNVTVDDTDGSPSGGFRIVYEPPGVWSTGQNCTTCEAQVDRTLARDGTWHDVSFISDNPPPSPISATLTFDGVAVYAYCIITRSFSNPNGNWDLSFLIDGEQAGTFKLAPNGDNTYQYNVPVYANTSLTSGTHTFTMVVGHPGGQSALALLDYMMFTQEVETTPSSGGSSVSPGPSSVAPGPSAPSPSNSSPTSPSPANDASTHTSSSSTTTIALSVSLGVAALLALIAGVFFFTRRRYRRRYAQPATSSALDSNGDKDAGDPGDPPSTPGFHVLPIFPARSVHESQVAHPFIIPPPPSPPAPSPSNATSYTWLPSAGAYVARKGASPSESPSVHSTASKSATRMDAELPPIPQLPSGSGGGVSSHEPSTTALAPAPAPAPAWASARTTQRYVQNDETLSPASLSPASASALGSWKARPAEVAPPVSPGASLSQAGGGAGLPSVGSEFGAEDEGPPPYAPRAS